MSIPVELTDLAAQIDRHGSVAYLITVNDAGLPHTVSVAASWDQDTLLVGAGRQTSANVARHPDVTLLWPAPPDQPYCLITDGQAHAGPQPETLVIKPTRAVLHRVVRADADLPSCVSLLDRR